MPRLLNPADIWSNVTGVGVFRDETTTPGDTTTDAAAAKGDSALSVVSETNFTTGNFARVGNLGTEEIVEIETTAAGSLTLKSALSNAHPSGVAVHQVSKTDIGDITDDGIDTEFQADRQQLNAATKRERLGFLIGNTNARVTFALENHALENLMLALGIDEGNITGAGTTADPWKANLDMDDWDGQLNQSWFFTGALKDGTTVEVHASRCEVDPNKTINYRRGQEATIPVAVDVGLVNMYQPALTA